MRCTGLSSAVTEPHRITVSAMQFLGFANHATHGLQVMFVLFAVAGALWGLLVVRTRAHMHRIHSLMGVLVAAKALTLLSQAGMYHLIRQTGHPDGWNFAFYIFTFLRGILFFTVLSTSSSASSLVTTCEDDAR